MVEAVGDMFWHQLVKEPTHRLGNTLDLCLTSSLKLVAGLEVIAPLGNSDHNGIEVNIVGRGQMCPPRRRCLTGPRRTCRP